VVKELGHSEEVVKMVSLLSVRIFKFFKIFTESKSSCFGIDWF